MFPESKVTEIYCMADDFCKEFTFQQEKYMIKDKKTRHRNKLNRMSDAEIMVILILFHSGGFRCFKHYYRADALYFYYILLCYSFVMLLFISILPFVYVDCFSYLYKIY